MVGKRQISKEGLKKYEDELNDLKWPFYSRIWRR